MKQRTTMENKLTIKNSGYSKKRFHQSNNDTHILLLIFTNLYFYPSNVFENIENSSC